MIILAMFEDSKVGKLTKVLLISMKEAARGSNSIVFGVRDEDFHFLNFTLLSNNLSQHSAYFNSKIVVQGGFFNWSYPKNSLDWSYPKLR